MRHFKQGPVIRSDEQLIVIVEQTMVNEAKYKKLPKPNVWKGCLETERREFQTYRDIADFALDNPDIQIIKALRICMSDGSMEDITEDVLDATAPEPVSAVYSSLQHSTMDARTQGLRHG